MFQIKNTIERKNKTINVANKRRQQKNRMVNEIKKKNKAKQTKRGARKQTLK